MAKAPTHNALETFPNPRPGREFEITIDAPEFTCICPKTGHPDFATMTLVYIPNKKCIELKSYKLYIHAWRNVGIFHEEVTNQIADDLIKALDPIALELEGDFHAHGGITTSVLVSYDRSQKKAAPKARKKAVKKSPRKKSARSKKK